MEMPATICNFLIPWHLKIKISCNFLFDCGNTYIVFPYIWGRICGSQKIFTQRTDYWLLWNSTWRFNTEAETLAHPKSLVQSEWNLNFKFLNRDVSKHVRNQKLFIEVILCFDCCETRCVTLITTCRKYPINIYIKV